MASTTNYSWSTPDDTALVKDGAAAIRTLGSSVDTTVKALNPGTTAGDIDYYTSSTAKSRVAIGTSGQVLTVNGSGVPEWASASAGGAAGTYTSKATSGATYYVRSGNTVNATSSPAVNTTYYTPINVSGITADRIFITTAATFSGTPVVRLGLYANDPTLNIPSTLIVDAGTVSPNASSTAYEITISQTLTAGLYWLAINMQTAGGGNDNFASCTATSANFSPIGMINNSQSTLLLGSSFINGYYQSSVTGAFANAGTLIRSVAAITIAGLRY